MSGAQVTEATVKELCDVAALTVELAKKAGADHAEVLVRDGSELTAKVRLGEAELVQEAGSRALGLRVLVGAKRAVTYTSDLRRESLAALCAESVALAQFAEPDECALPPDPALLAKSVPELDLYDPAVAEALWELAGNETYMMVGDGAVCAIADSYIKGIRDFDASTALAAMRHQTVIKGDSAPAVRPGYHEYLRYGYIPFEQDTTGAWWTWGPVSTTMEYCLADWCQAQMAAALGKRAEAAGLRRRSLFYRNLFDSSLSLVRPRRKSGAWLTPFDPLAVEGSGSWSGSGGPGFVEGNAWQYTWFVPHDIPGLIGLFGGGLPFVARLNECFARGQFTINNEPDIACPYLFTYVPGGDSLTALYVRDIMDRDFAILRNTTR